MALAHKNMSGDLKNKKKSYTHIFFKTRTSANIIFVHADSLISTTVSSIKTT